MTKNKKILQIVLTSIGLFLILVTYFLYPTFKQKTYKDEVVQKEEISPENAGKGNTFENIEYKGLYDSDKQFSIKSKKAYILNEKPNIVYMTNMKVTMYMNDGRIITITSDKGRYNKVTYDSFFEENVKATDGKTIILSENLDLIATEDFASAYNNVVLTSEKNSLHADKLDYDFMTKRYNVSMFGKQKVKVKIVQ